MKRIEKLLFMGFAILLILISAQKEGGGADWKYYINTEYSREYFDKSNIIKDNDICKIWIKKVWTNEGKKLSKKILEDQGINSKEYDLLSYTLQLTEINKNERKWRIAEIWDYDLNQRLISAHEYYKDADYNKKWHNIVPASAIEKLMKFGCRRR